MNYFTSGLYGNLEVYKRIKNILTEDDHLWILGDILDGNEEHPEDCITILKDIASNKQITLILGDHEYLHTLRILSIGDTPDEANVWEDTLIGMDISGEPLLNYLNDLSEDEVFSIGHFLAECEVSDMVKIGDRLFYLCHGAPFYRANMEGGDMTWQYGITTDELDTNKQYMGEIASDLNMPKFSRRYGGVDIRKLLIITGHKPISEYEEDGLPLTDGIIVNKRKFCLNQNITADDYDDEKWKILGIDAASYFIMEV